MICRGRRKPDSSGRVACSWLCKGIGETVSRERVSKEGSEGARKFGPVTRSSAARFPMPDSESPRLATRQRLYRPVAQKYSSLPWVEVTPMPWQSQQHATRTSGKRHVAASDSFHAISFARSAHVCGPLICPANAHPPSKSL